MPTKTARKGKQAPAASTADKPTSFLVNVVLDRSGSMVDTAAGTISGYNEYINGLKTDGNAYNVSLIQFDSPASVPELTVTYMDKPLAEVGELTAEQYQPRGMTPLYDAIGECIRRVEAKGRGIITVIITDGDENSSREFNQESIKALIKEKEAAGWSFVFLGANIDAAAVGGSMGISQSACANYAQGSEQSMFRSFADSTNLRALTYTNSGMQAAVQMSAFTDDQKAAMMGGQPSVSSTVFPQAQSIPAGIQFPVGGVAHKAPFFRPGRPVKAAPVNHSNPRQWRVKEPVPQP